MTHVTWRLTAKNRDQLRNPTHGNRVWATFTFLINSSSPCLQAKLDSGCCLFYKVKFSSGIFAKKLLRNAAMRLGLWLALPAGIVEAMSTGLCGPFGTIFEFIFTSLKCEASSTQCPKWRHCVWRVRLAIALYSRSYRVDQKSGPQTHDHNSVKS